MSCDVGKATEGLENELWLGEVMERLESELNQVVRPQDLNLGPPECESRVLPRSHLTRSIFFLFFDKDFYTKKKKKERK